MVGGLGLESEIKLFAWVQIPLGAHFKSLFCVIFQHFLLKTYNLCYLVLQKLAKKFNFMAVALKKNPFLFCSEVFFILSTFLHIIDFLWNNTNIIGHQNGWLFDFAQVRAIFFSGKKPDPENPGKIRIWFFSRFWSDFKNRQ